MGLFHEFSPGGGGENAHLLGLGKVLFFLLANITFQSFFCRTVVGRKMRWRFHFLAFLRLRVMNTTDDTGVFSVTCSPSTKTLKCEGKSRSCESPQVGFGSYPALPGRGCPWLGLHLPCWSFPLAPSSRDAGSCQGHCVRGWPVAGPLDHGLSRCPAFSEFFATVIFLKCILWAGSYVACVRLFHTRSLFYFWSMVPKLTPSERVSSMH